MYPHPAARAPNHGYYYPQPQYPYHHQPNVIYDEDYNIVERNPYPFDGPYFDRRMVEPSHPMRAGQIGYDRHGRLRPYPFYDSRYSFHGRVDPYTSYQAYYETPLLAFPQPPPPASVHPFWTPSSCTIM
ncbi:uncharacterized protein [Medicago truncatula]|uniref:uncharacterized protein n=1 Tax=Medicago truncatula TaxID=3880 RepID=UPI0000D5EBDB|nr:uncharacterized protein LOC11419135 [Medicago truncatula]